MSGFTFKFGYGYGVGSTYRPYINYTWSTSLQDGVMVSPNIGTSNVPLLWYSGNPMDFQGSQYVDITLPSLSNIYLIQSFNSIITTVDLSGRGGETYSIGKTDGTGTLLDGNFDFFILKSTAFTTEQITQASQYPNAFYESMKNDVNSLFVTDFRGLGNNIKDNIGGLEYTIINYSPTMRTNFQTEQNGLQDLTRSFDSSGFYIGVTDYLNGNSVGYGDTQFNLVSGVSIVVTLTANISTDTENILGNGVNGLLIRRFSSGSSFCYFGGGNRSLGNIDLETQLVILLNSDITATVYKDKIILGTINGTLTDFSSLFLGINSLNAKIKQFQVHYKILTNEEIQAL